MTNREYLSKTLSGLSVSDEDIDLILLKGGIDGSSETDIHACDVAIYRRMSVLLRGGLRNITEGGYSVSWNMEAVKFFYRALCQELGLENVLEKTPKIRNRSNIW